MSIVKLNNQGVKNATAFGSITGLGSMIFIKKLTASSSATLSFVDGSNGVVLDNTYKEYLFTFKDIHGSSDTSHFGFNGSIDSGSNYNVTKTTTYFQSFHAEDDSDSGISYYTDSDIAQGTGFQRLLRHMGADNDQCGAGYLHLFNPSSTTFVKHFIANTVMAEKNNLVYDPYIAGYFNSTSSIDAIQFKMESGNIDAGDICLYGIA